MDIIWGDYMKKYVRIISFCLALVFLFSSCKNPVHQAKKPLNQPYTQWISEDGNISFNVSNYGWASGKMVVDNKTVDFILTQSMGDALYFCSPTVWKTHHIRDEDEYEYWECLYKSKKEFVAYVVETKYF